VSEARRCDFPMPGCVSSFERPTKAALDTCKEAYVQRGATNHSQYVLLVTDGEPTTCSGGSSGCTASTTAGNLRAIDVKTLVVVLGNVPEHDCLRNIALSGDADTGRDPFYYSATSPETLKTAIMTIIGSAARDACHVHGSRRLRSEAGGDGVNTASISRTRRARSTGSKRSIAS